MILNYLICLAPLAFLLFLWLVSATTSERGTRGYVNDGSSPSDDDVAYMDSFFEE